MDGIRSIKRTAVNVAIMAVAIKTSWGCGNPAPAVPPHPQSLAVEDRIAGIRLATVRSDRSSIPHLVDRLDDEDVAVRWAAILALEELTDHRFGYRSAASVENRASATARWRQFLRRNRAEWMPADSERQVDQRTPRSTDSDVGILK